MDERILIGVLVCVVLLVAGVIWKRKEKFVRPRRYILTTNEFVDDSIQAGLSIKDEKELRRAVIGRNRF